MKKKYEKPYICGIRIKGEENIADGSGNLMNASVQTDSLYATITYANLKSY